MIDTPAIDVKLRCMGASSNAPVLGGAKFTTCGAVIMVGTLPVGTDFEHRCRKCKTVSRFVCTTRTAWLAPSPMPRGDFVVGNEQAVVYVATRYL